jgi:hypothetical protein
VRRSNAGFSPGFSSRLGLLLRAASGRAGSIVSGEGVLGAVLVDPPRAPVPYSADDASLRRSIRNSALMGFLGSVAVFIGASDPYSPFTVKMIAMPAWFFGLRSEPILQHVVFHPGDAFYLSLAAFYGGLVLLMRAWMRLMRLSREHPGIPLRIYVGVMALWTLPMLFVAPVLSRDAYSYVAQGEMMSRHINPYSIGVGVLGRNANSYAGLTDPIWMWASSPYGPVFLSLAGWIQVLVNHSELGALVLWRIVALFGVGLLAVFVPRLARRFGRDSTAAFALAVMNPIVLIHFVGGEHNDALMLGLLVAGLAFAHERRPMVATVLVALAALVKVPAALGFLYIGWEWYGAGADWRSRLKGLAAAGVVGVGLMAVVTQLVGLGWGWIGGLTNPDSVRSYLDPMTALGLGLGKLVGAAGFGDHSHVLLTVVRGLGALAAGAIGLRLLLRSRGGVSSLRGIGLTLLAVVVLGPIMQPWYLAWGVVVLGAVAAGRLRLALIWLTVTVTFLGVGDAQYFVSQLNKSSPVIVGLASAGMAVLLFAPMLRRALAQLREQRAMGKGATVRVLRLPAAATGVVAASSSAPAGGLSDEATAGY